jgi:hypothetical protein
LKLIFDALSDSFVVQQRSIHILIRASRYRLPGGGYVFPAPDVVLQALSTEAAHASTKGRSGLLRDSCASEPPYGF